MLEHGLISPGGFHHLREVIQDSDSLRSDLLTQEIDDYMGTAVFLAHVLNHLCLAWHQRNMEMHISMSLSQEEYEQLSYRIPNWEGKFRLIEIPLSVECSDNTTIRFHDTFRP